MLDFARTLVRSLEPVPGRRVALALSNKVLLESVTSLLDTAGVTVVAEEGAHGCVVQFDGITREIPPATRAALNLVSTGGRVVAISLGGTQGDLDQVRAYWATRLRCEELDGEALKSSTALWGLRTAPLTNQDRKRLRKIGHALEPTVLLGRAGVTSEVVAAAETALLRHGIVKVKLTRACELEKGTALDDLTWASGAEMVQRVGKTAVLYRRDVALDPPVKRGRRR